MTAVTGGSPVELREIEELTSRCEEAGVTLHVGARRWDVVLSRPDRRNAQTPLMWAALAQVGEAVAEHRPDVVVLRALGPSFSAGLDRAMFTGSLPGGVGLPALAAMPDAEIDQVIAEYQRAFTWWREVDAVTVAAVQGHAVGAGFQLALGCDIRVVADDVSLVMKETALGLVPDLAGTAPLVDAVGYSVALEICATGRPVGAQEAVSRGIAGSSVPADQLEQAVDRVVAALLAAPAGAVAATKGLLRDATERTAQQQRAAERAAQAGRLRAIVRQRSGQA